MFDTHCHLNLDIFKGQLTAVINDGRDKGVNYFLVPGINFESSKTALQIAIDYKNVFASAGIHPTEDLKEVDTKKILDKIFSLADNSEDIVAIGEVGIDLYRFKAPLRIQKLYFEEQIKIAIKTKKAIIIHNRIAGKEIIKSLEKFRLEGLKGTVVFHCCEPDWELLEFAVSNNIFIGVNGDVTYDTVKQKFVKEVPINLLLLETDSPYLVPEPLKSNKIFPNEPGNLKIIAEKVAELIKTDINDLVKKTTDNGKKLFGI
jgi:TatD DNase family protein